MKLAIVVVALVSAVLAAPATRASPDEDKTLAEMTDSLMFDTSLPKFTLRRNARDPPQLDWSSDGCTSAPNNPFGFPFLPACHRHDFGYQNFRAQNRFTSENKLRIDDTFKADMYFQCAQVAADEACQRLADWYYLAVRLFGGHDATKRDEGSPSAQLDRAEKAYRVAVAKAQRQGLLPVLPNQ